VNSIAVQAVAVLTLTSADYGHFSLLYIGYAWFVSLTYSVVAEPWLREWRRDGLAAWSDYSSVTVALAAAAGIPALTVGLFLGEWVATTMAALATSFAVYRLASRFHEVVAGTHTRVWVPDALGAFAMVAAWGVASRIADALTAVAIGWLASSIIAAMTSRLPRGFSIRRIREWISARGRSIRALLADSLLQDVSTVALPFVLAPILGLRAFGVYRALASAALPVRLILLPIRPSIGTLPRRYFARPRALFSATGAAIGLAAVTSGALFLLASGVLKPGSPLAILGSDYAVAVGIFILFNAVGTLYYFVARAHFRAGPLLWVRIEQMIGAVAAPIVGYAALGLDGVIWGSVLAAAVHAAVLVAVTFAPWSGGDRSTGVRPQD
jgi:hypothetical protein